MGYSGVSTAISQAREAEGTSSYASLVLKKASPVTAARALPRGSCDHPGTWAYGVALTTGQLREPGAGRKALRESASVEAVLCDKVPQPGSWIGPRARIPARKGASPEHPCSRDSAADRSAVSLRDSGRGKESFGEELVLSPRT